MRLVRDQDDLSRGLFFMLKTYDSRDAIPEPLREYYKEIDKKWVPDISDDHLALTTLSTTSAQLLNEKKASDKKAADLQVDLTQTQADLEAAKADLVSAKAGGLPRNHVAIPKPEAETWEQVKALGADPVAKLTEYATLKEESERRTREVHLKAVAKVLGYDNEEAFVRLQGLPEMEIRGEKGKETVIAKVKDGENTVEKPAQEVIESSADIAPFLSSLKTQPASPGAKPSPRANGKGDPEAAKRSQSEHRRSYQSL